VVILTHRHVHDFEILEYCIEQPFSYLGMIGSRKKVGNAFQQLREKGVDEEAIKRIHAPIGMNIGAESPAEIAVAIAAQLVTVRSGFVVK
jgi:xanthine dehydrogenase accessory factor